VARVLYNAPYARLTARGVVYRCVRAAAMAAVYAAAGLGAIAAWVKP
jgi:hypothetical protein